jgi:hypothetical protein
MKQKFRDISLSKDNKVRLQIINKIIESYQAQGYTLTLRQLYYQLVSRDVVPNQQKEYAKLSKLLKEGRMAGIVDWAAIEDRLRVVEKPASWADPESILDSCIYGYELPRMQGQKNYVEVWVEKDALSGVLKRVTEPYHIPIMVNRGYSSVSAMYDAYNRFNRAVSIDQDVYVLYLGDFDPSGMDMIRDVRDRILEFFGDNYAPFEIIPVALTREQIDEYEPPPNPAKMSDPRAGKFVDEHGDTSWEVDALPPEVLNRVLDRAIKDLIDFDLYRSVVESEEADKEKLEKAKTYIRKL